MAELFEPDEPTVENLLRVLITQTQRLYDVQLAILDKLDPERADQVMETHSNFDVIGPPPFIEVDTTE